MTEQPRPPIGKPVDLTPGLVVVDAAKLFQGQREIIIEHDGVRYRLRLTRRNKLILQK
jgi:hemin uptake protein HemP